MTLKKPSSQAGSKRPDPDPAAIEALVNSLADRRYGGELEELPKPRPKPITLSLPSDVVLALEDQVRANKLSGEGPRTVSGIVKALLADAGYVSAK